MTQSSETTGNIVKPGFWTVAYHERDLGDKLDSWFPVNVDTINPNDPRRIRITRLLASQVVATDFRTAFEAAERAAEVVRRTQPDAFQQDRVGIAHVPTQKVLVENIVQDDLTMGQAARVARLAFQEMLGDN